MKMKKKEGELHLKYRPRNFDEFIGSEAVKESILSSLHRTHTYLLSGLRGTGKTTLARLIAYELQIADWDIIEMDAADRTGVDDARKLKSTVVFAPMQGKNKIYIIDEVHRLSPQAQDSLLKVLEEPPEHVYFVLCTTEVNKLLKTIRSRAKEYELKPLGRKNTEKLIDWICRDEELQIDSQLKKAIVNCCEGIPREIVISLDKVRDVEDVDRALELIQSVSEKAEVIELFRELVKGGSWNTVRGLLANIEEEPEQIRRALLGYLNKVLLNSESGKAKRIADMILLFGSNFYDGGKAELSACCYLSTQM